jgi:elongation factor P
MSDANSVNVGNVIKYKDRFWNVLKKGHVKPGKGGAFVQLELKDIISGTKLNERFRATEGIEKAFLEDMEFQYQYDEGKNLAFMNMKTYEQISLPKTLLGETEKFLQEGMDVKVKYCEDTPISIKLPDTVILEIKETEPVVKGQTAASSFKPAILENGVRIMVPPFVNSSDKVVVRTEDATYVERAKK